MRGRGSRPGFGGREDGVQSPSTTLVLHGVPPDFDPSRHTGWCEPDTTSPTRRRGAGDSRDTRPARPRGTGDSRDTRTDPRSADGRTPQDGLSVGEGPRTTEFRVRLKGPNPTGWVGQSGTLRETVETTLVPAGPGSGTSKSRQPPGDSAPGTEVSSSPAPQTSTSWRHKRRRFPRLRKTDPWMGPSVSTGSPGGTVTSVEPRLGTHTYGPLVPVPTTRRLGRPETGRGTRAKESWGLTPIRR